MTEEIIWEDPPADAAAPARITPYTKFAQALRQRPRTWARVPGEDRTAAGAKQTALNIRRGKMRDFQPSGAFETRVAESKIWVRYVGDEEAPSAATTSGSLPRGTVEQLSKKIRAWGQANGYELSEHGRLPRAVIEAYQAAHPHVIDGDADELLDEADSAGS